MSKKEVPISPGIEVLEVLRHLKYKVWFALAEYIDNSLQSFLDHEFLLKKDNPEYKLSIKINIDTVSKQATICDNAGGIIAEEEYAVKNKDYEKTWIPCSIYKKEYGAILQDENNKDIKRDERWHFAFKLAKQPKKDGGLNRFGMGMKTASLWLSDLWSVRTKAVGDKTIRKIIWDFDDIKKKSQETLFASEEKSENLFLSFTELKLLKWTDNFPTKQQSITRSIEFLSSMYRNFLKRDDVEIEMNVNYSTTKKSEKLEFNHYPILNAPKWNDLTGSKIYWKKEIDLDFGPHEQKDGTLVNQRMYGFVGLLAKMSNKNAGFVFFSNNRIIDGLDDTGKFKPKFMGGVHSNSSETGRIFGELHLEGFELTHTKDGFIGKDNMQETIEFLLRGEIDQEPDLLTQAKKFKVSETSESQKRKAKTDLINYKQDYSKTTIKSLSKSEINKKLKPKLISSGDTIKLETIIDDREYKIEITTVSELTMEDLYKYEDVGEKIKINLNISHPFFQHSTKIGIREIAPIVHALIIAEVIYKTANNNSIQIFNYHFQNTLRTLITN